MPSRTVLTCFGIQRTGNHAIIGWILDNLNARCLHLNNVFAPYPFHFCSEIESRMIDIRKYISGSMWRRWRRRAKVGCYGPASSRLLHSSRISGSEWDYLIVSWESKFLYDQVVQSYFDNKEKHVSAQADYVQLLFLRDPYNHFASLYKRAGGLSKKRIYLYKELWKHYAREFISQTFLPNPLVLVNYNDWVSFSDYRCELAKKLGFHTDGSAYAGTPGYGGGSSFVGKKLVRPEDVLQRWKTFEGDSRFVGIFDDEMVSLAESIFSFKFPFKKH